MLTKINLLLIFLIATTSTFVVASGSPAVSYEKVMSCEGKETGEIRKAIIEYLSKQDYTHLKQSAEQITTTGALRIYNYIISSIKNPAGEIVFDLKIDIKDGKFRCIMHNISFVNLERDRYGKFVYTGDTIHLSKDNLKSSVFSKIERQAVAYLHNMAFHIKQILADNSAETDW
ncbi:MAG: hypothetical protein WD555_02525 [Fulvivirga sp.]